MIKCEKTVITLMLSFFLQLNVSGQDKTDFLDVLSEKLLKYCEKYPREEIFVHTDRDEYIAGEEIWVKIYLIDRQSNKPSDESKIAYLEILNADNRAVVQKQFRLNKGSGPGMVVLPDTLSSGNYTLRAYTNWMKNFLPVNCFMKKLNIYNTLSNRAFRTSMTHVMNERAGDKGLKTNTTIPGIDINISTLRPDSLEINIITDRNIRSRNDGLCYLFIQTRGNINYKGPVVLHADNTKIFLSGKLLMPGINQLTFFSPSGQLMAEKYIYTPAREIHGMTLSSSDINKIRNRIVLEIDIDKGIINPADSLNLSLSISPATNHRLFSDINDYMVFGSEFGVLPDQLTGSTLREVPAEEINRFLDSVKSYWINWEMILSGSFPDVRYGKEIRNHYLYGRLANRSSRTPDAGRYLFLSTPGKIATFQYAISDINGDFYFSLPIDDKIKDIIIQPEEVDRNNNVKIEPSFSVEYPRSEKLTDVYSKEFPSYISKMGVNYQIRKIYGTGIMGNLQEFQEYAMGSKRFYGNPDIELIMDDYIKLPVMSEVFYELLPGVFLRNRKSFYEINIADRITSLVYEKPPVLFVDGVVIADPAIIAELDPEVVEKIDAIKERYMVGDYLFYGLVNVITRPGDYSFVSLPDYAVRLSYRVVDPVISFTTPDYSTPEKLQNRIPDFRNTLYWNPSVKTDKDGKARIELWSSDFVSVYLINIQGIANDGKLISYNKTIKVE